MVRNILFVFGVIAVIVLDVAALQDIFSGREPDLTGEWAILAASLGLFIFLGLFYYRSRTSSASRRRV